MKLEPNSVVNKSKFIRLLARKAGFTIGDTKIFWDAVEQVFSEAIESGTELRVGLGRLFYTISSERDMVNPRTLERIHVQGSRRVVFKLNSSLRGILRRDMVRKPWKKTLKDIDPQAVDYGDLHDIEEDTG